MHQISKPAKTSPHPRLLPSLMIMLLAAAPAACISKTPVTPPASVESYEQAKPPAKRQPEQRSHERRQTRETVSIDGTDYVVPAPWSGNRLTPPSLPFSAFRRIPLDYTHERTKLYVVESAIKPLIALLEQAEADGVSLKVHSAYRSVAYQKRIFKRMLGEGRSFDDIVRYVAPPGYSQHMFGTAVDFYPSNWRFAETEQYEWLQKNAERFGFNETYSRFNSLSMPWEAWHWGYEPAIATGARDGDVPAVGQTSPPERRRTGAKQP